jgi:hypothetical protein
MYQSEAMLILGLKHTEIHDELKIKQAWKQKIRGIHPDKNHQLQENATKATQKLNEAKDTLLEKFIDLHQKKIYEDEEEHILHEKQQNEAEIRRQAEVSQLEEKCDDIYNKMKEIKRERYNKNRKKRLPSARVHKKINEYCEGKELVEEIQKFFQEEFKAEVNSTLLVSDMMDLFIKSRERTTALERNLFKRHSKKLFLALWPKATYSTNKNKRCFRNVCPK